MGPGWNRKFGTLSHAQCLSANDLRASCSVISVRECVKSAQNPGSGTVSIKMINTDSKPSLNVPFSQRRAKSQALLNTQGGRIKHLPQHIMPELLYDLSRTGSHISLDLTSSEDEVESLNKAKQGKNFGQDNHSIVRPNAPKVITYTLGEKLPPPSTAPVRSAPHSPTKTFQTRRGPQTTHPIMLLKHPQSLKSPSSHVTTPNGRFKELGPTASLPSSYQLRTRGNRNQVVKNAPPGSVEDFMSDATQNLSLEEYDPYGLVRRNFNDWFSDSNHRNTIQGETTDSRTSSGQFSLGSTQSVPTMCTIPRTFDRRRRRNNQCQVEYHIRYRNRLES
ncbi:hypothetical protein FGIG_00172 [Fasciola gigantica]|uniref:Uncharacterized protein n=1 Tax=Fasciola gigantica TaxID=46835 RepID=A0A504Y7A1_FASGI|nr:hypothetical protein FGIG_00172 [Fasciola gigantica]